MALALDQQSIHNLLVFALVCATIATDSGVLILNRFLLLDSVFRFPYPVIATLVQLSIIYFSLLITEYPICIFADCTSISEDVDLLEADKDSRPNRNAPRHLPPTRLFRGFSPCRLWLRNFTSSPERGSWKAMVNTLPLTLGFLLKILLGNVVMLHLTVPAYTISQIAAIPLAFAVSATFNKDWHSIVMSSSAVLAITGLVFAVLPLMEPVGFGSLLLGMAMVMVDAMVPIFMLRTSNGKFCVPCFGTEEGDRSNHRIVRGAATSTTDNLPRALSTFWPKLQRAILLSILGLAPACFLTGEAQHIWHNPYFLDTASVRILLVSNGLLNGMLLVVTALLITATLSPSIKFWSLFSNAIQVAMFCKSSLVVNSWLGLAGCWFCSICFFFSQLIPRRQEERAKNQAESTQVFSLTSRTITVILVLFASISIITRMTWNDKRIATLEEPICYPSVSIPSAHTSRVENSFHDDYLGPRPDADTTADLPLILHHCEEVNGGLGVDDVINCARYLASSGHEYLVPPPTVRQSKQAYDEALNHTATNGIGQHQGRPTPSSKSTEIVAALNSSTEICHGPIFPFHVYWTGPATWRLELFVKAYLYTQNLPCSRLWIWLDADTHPHAVERMLCEDPTFRRFLPLVERGDIAVKAWHFPKSVPLPAHAFGNPTFHQPITLPHSKKIKLQSDDHIIHNATGKWLLIPSPSPTTTAVQISDAVRFIVLHLHGGLYLDMDVMLLRDMRPLLLQPHPFAEQWVERCPRWSYNTAVLSLQADSSLSTYLLHGAVTRIGMNFHPQAIGRMMWCDNRHEELAMLQNAVFDPLVTDKRRVGTGNCTVPCHKNFEQAFRAEVEEEEKEWSAWEEEDRERTMSKFFRGSFAYHIHNQWDKFPEPTSWMDVITTAQDGFFDGSRTNAYGEKWEGPQVLQYDRDTWPGF